LKEKKLEFRKKAVSMSILVVLLTACMIESLFPRSSVLNVSAVETTENIGIYWDQGCRMKVNSIDWGVLSPGEVKKVVVYVRNEGNESLFLVLTPANWNPENASYYLNFSWTCEYNRIELGEVVQFTLSLLVSPYTKGIYNFSFDIVFETKPNILGDINKDGVVDIYDVVIVTSIYRSTPKDSNWNPDADLNKNGVIDIYDVVLVTSNYGKT
jgi:hypothetical protein